ncbi:Ig-like domain-containing protein [Sphingomonas sp. PAMC 26617]|uniref:Ig-like domain-containing protein n=1 Tax=Sphingomonas sp. PAMC 26617 TaxID=1112216 RepID=UPI000308F8BF|nr:Ig-like domain-containing protein [Sphingomonas sp. PAMC 26617]
MPLEPRMMFDGAAIVTAHDAVSSDSPLLDGGDLLAKLATADTAAAQSARSTADPARPAGSGDTAGVPNLQPTEQRAWLQSAVATDAVAAASPDATSRDAAGQSFIFIDSSLSDYEQLVEEWRAQGTVIVLDAGGDGLAQISDAVSGHTNVGAIHIVSHGVAGAFFLGATRVDAATATGALADRFAAIGTHLSADADILIYGCDVAAGPSGQALVDAIATTTGADVAASIDDTGSAMRGGNWVLENRLGTVEHTALTALDWHGLLATAQIAVNSATTVLKVYNAAGTEVANSATGAGFSVIIGASRSTGISAGYAVWTNAATLNGQALDLRAVVVGTTLGTDVINFDRPVATTNDPGFLLATAGGPTSGVASAQVRWELVLGGTNTPVAADVSFTIADIDGTGLNPNAFTREGVIVSTDTLTSFQSAAISDVRFTTMTPGQVAAFGTQNELSLPPLPISAAKFNWTNTSTWTITYQLDRAASAQAGFNHDGNNEFAFGAGGVTTSIPRLDLDSSDSTATGSSYLGTFIENGSGIRIANTDATILNPIGSVTSLTVGLSNAQSGDQLLVNGSTATSGTVTGGISYAITGSTLTFTGAASAATYQAALGTVTFRNTGERPATVDRTINVSFANATFSSNVAVATIKVIEVNDLPVAVNDGPLTTAEDTPIANIAVLTNDTDLDDKPVPGTTTSNVVVTAASAPNGTVTINADGTLNYMPNANYNGTDTISYTISDGRGGTSSAIVPITITPVNDAPTRVGSLAPRANVDAASGISVATAAAFADVDGTALTYSATGLPNGLSINASTGVITGTIDRSASQVAGGVYTVVVTASDGALSTTQTFAWTITNPPPVAVNDPALTVNEDIPGTTVNVLANDSDPDGDPISIVSASAGRGSVVVNANGTITYTPNANFNGSDTISYTISDSQGGTATATIPVTVVAVNDAPVRVGTLPAQGTVDAQAGISVATAGGFSDVDDATLRYTASGLPAGLAIDPATGVISGTIDRSASQGGSGGVYAVTVTATDAGGLAATQTFAWSVTNPAPTAANDSAATSEDTPVTINVLANDSDPDRDPLSVVSASAANGTVTINPDGTLRYVPNANFNGQDTITYTISDGQGGTASASVAVAVAAVNDAPVAVGTLPPQAGVDAQGGITVPTAGAFSDVDDTTLRYSATGLPAGLTINAATGVISGTIDRSASQGGSGGVYAVTVTATDAGGLRASQTFVWAVSNPAPITQNDAVTIDEDTTVTVNVLANDSDPDGDPLTVVSAMATVGSAVLSGNQIQYTPPANFNGTATITYRVSDGQGGTATATLTVTVTPVNDAPVATPIAPRSVTDGAAIAVPVAGNFSDVEGDALRFAAIGLPPGLGIDPVTGVISGTISNSASQTNGGMYSATITASDGKGGTVTQTISFTVANPPPAAANDSVNTIEDTPVTIDVLANDTDPDRDPLTVVTAAAGNGTVTITPDGTLRYVPNANFNGTDTITYTISDGQGGTSTATVSVTVDAVNDPPLVSGSIGDQASPDSQVVHLPVGGAFADPEGDTLAFTAQGLPAGLTIDAATGVISGTIDHSASQANAGVYTVTVTASDGKGGSVSQTFVWSVTNPAPVAANDSVTVDEDGSVRIPVLANDGDPDRDPLTVTAASAGNGSVTISVDGSLVYTPNPNFNGPDTIVYRITDGDGGVATATVTVTVKPVNDPPVTSGIPAQNGDDGTAVSFSIASSFSDPDGDPLTFTATNLPPNLTLDPMTGVISGVLDPSTSVNGPYVVTVTATDPSGAAVTTTFLYSVQNNPPSAVNDMAATPEDVPVTIAVLTNDSDPNHDPLQITSASATHGSVVVNADGTVTFTPAADFNGIAVVSYTISDGKGGVSTATATITVTPVNDAPDAVAIPALANQDGESASVNVGTFFSDRDGDTLVFAAAGLPPGIGIDPATGILSGTLAADASQGGTGGVYTVTVTATDPSGQAVSRIFPWSITNPAPVAANDSAFAADAMPVAITVLANDHDPEGDPLTVTRATALHGTVSIGADGVLTYTPARAYNGTDTITYAISDGNGGSATAAVTVGVSSSNQAPVAADDHATTSEDTPVTIAVLSNDSDVDGNGLTVTEALSPDGTVAINPDGTITFTPAANFNGTTTIRYAISDGYGGTSSATVMVDVTPVNDAPVANPSSATTAEDTPVVLAVLANDTDADGNPLWVTSAMATNGTVVILADGTVRYTPDANFTGTDTITYTIGDGQDGFSTSTVTVTVTPVNDAPTATPITPQVSADGSTVSLPVADTFADIDGGALRFSATGLPAGLSIDPATGVISGTIDRSASQGNGGSYGVVVTASDGNGGTVSTPFSWWVTNPAPTAANDSATTAEDTPVIVLVLANDSDPDRDPFTVVSATSPDGVATINPDGTITFTPAANFNGVATVAYAISDGQGGMANATLSITVTPVNDAPVVDTPLANVAQVDGATVSLPVAGAFSDVDGDTLSFTAAGLPAGLVIDPATGVISGTIDRSASQVGGGVYAVTVTASDGNGGTVATGFTVTVTNPGPSATNDSATTAEDTPVTIPVLANDSDPDGDPLQVTSASSPDGAVTINADGTLTFVPAANFNGATTIDYTISDGQGGMATATVAVTVTPVNDAPVVATPLPDVAGVDGAAVSLPTAGRFSDLDGDTLRFRATGLPAGLVIDPATGLISGTLDRSASQQNGGVYGVAVTANDGAGGTATATFTVTATNPAPTPVDDRASTPEDTPVTIAVLTNDTDPDNDPLQVASAYSPDGTVAINPDGTLTFVPAANFNGATTITYAISDGQGGMATATVAVTVTPVNDAPMVDMPLSNRSDLDGTPVSVATSGSFSDIDRDPLTFSATGLPDRLTIDPATGVISGTLSADASQVGGGIYRVSVTASDGAGGSATSTFVWSIANPPPVAANDAAMLNEDPAAPVTIAVLANDRDPDSDPLHVTTAAAAHGTVTVNADGTLSYTPAANYNGTDTITYTISDGQGGVSTATVAVTIDPVNDAPVSTALPDQSSVDSDSVSFPAGSAFGDIDSGSLTYDATDLPPGLTIDPATGVISGTLDSSASQGGDGGVYRVTVTASDGAGGSVSTSFTWTVTNPAPTAVNDGAATSEDVPVTIAVLANDSDPDHDPLGVASATADTGTVMINPDGTLTYTPRADYAGTDTITYTISDGQGGVSTATVAVTVVPVNDPPVAVNDTATTNEDTPVTLAVLRNDSDREGNPLTVTAAHSAQGATTINPDGTIGFTPAAHFTGVATVTYAISDGNGGSATATATITVLPVNHPPIAVADRAATNADVPVVIPLLGNDRDVDGDSLSVVRATAANGTVTILSDGTVRYTPNAGFVGTDTIAYTILDGKGGTATGTASVVVTRINTPPVDGNEAIEAVGGVRCRIPVLANVSDADNDPVCVFSATADVGTVTINPDGTLAYVAPIGFQGTACIRYVVSDGRGGFTASVAMVRVAQAAADVNALLGLYPRPGVPDGARGENVRDPAGSFLAVPLIIDDTVNGFRSLHGTPDLGGDGPLLTAVNGISWLGGQASPGRNGMPAVDDTIRHLDRVRNLRDDVDRLFDPRWGDFTLKPLNGFSVRQLATGNDQVMIESIVRDRILYMEMKDVAADDAPRITDYSLRMRDGSRLPDWVTMDQRGLAILERPVDAEELHLVVHAVRADGRAFDIPVVVQGATGEIQLDSPIADRRAGAAAPLSRTLHAARTAFHRETAALADAFSDHAQGMTQ